MQAPVLFNNRTIDYSDLQPKMRTNDSEVKKKKTGSLTLAPIKVQFDVSGDESPFQSCYDTVRLRRVVTLSR